MVKTIGYCLVFLALASMCAAPSTAQKVVTAPDGERTLQLTSGAQSAVEAYESAHSDMQPANCKTLGYDKKYCDDQYGQWLMAVEGAKAAPQYEYAVWGDFRHTGATDVAIPFFSKQAVNNFGWRRWEFIVFENLGADRYRPVTALKGSWGACFDGVLFHPARKQIEFWCNSMGGHFKWNGTTFVGRLEKGD